MRFRPLSFSMTLDRLLALAVVSGLAMCFGCTIRPSQSLETALWKFPQNAKIVALQDELCRLAATQISKMNLAEPPRSLEFRSSIEPQLDSGYIDVPKFPDVVVSPNTKLPSHMVFVTSVNTISSAKLAIVFEIMTFEHHDSLSLTLAYVWVDGKWIDENEFMARMLKSDDATILRKNYILQVPH